MTHLNPLDEPYVDLPLPGFYPIITMQLNATVHAKTGLAKWVLCLREPTSQVEILRTGRGLEHALTQLVAMDDAVLTAVRQMLYLADLGDRAAPEERLRRLH